MAPHVVAIIGAVLGIAAITPAQSLEPRVPSRAGIAVQALPAQPVNPATVAPAFVVLHNFDLFTEGGNPFVAETLTLAGDVLYGATMNGGANGKGVLFSVNTNGTSYTVIHAFSATTQNGTNADGTFPAGTLMFAGNRLYGTASAGGSLGNGVLFSLNPDGTGFSTLYNFSGAQVNAGYGLHSPQGHLVLSDDTLYGITVRGGSPSYDGSVNGRIFAVNTGGGGTIPYAFPDVTWDGNHGYTPYGPGAGLVLAGNKLYGVTVGGGYDSNGTVFTVNTNGSGFSIVHYFTNPVVDGKTPRSPLVLSGDTLYGTTTYGGSQDSGVIFAVNVDGSGFNVLHSFGPTEGQTNDGGLLLSGDTLYGARLYNGTSFHGTIFSMKTNGAQYTTLHSFDRFPEGATPTRLIQSGRYLYGMTATGGSHDKGTIFRFSLGFTDDPLTAGSTVIRAVHITELRARIDAQRALKALAPYAWTDATLVIGQSVISAQHIIDLRAALAEVYAAASLTPPAYADPTLGAGMTMTVAHISELRTAVIAVE